MDAARLHKPNPKVVLTNRTDLLYALILFLPGTNYQKHLTIMNYKKMKLLKLCTWLLLFVFLGAGCQKDELEFADESIEISTLPNISVYKTNHDYFDKISVQFTSDGLINEIPAYSISDIRISKDKDGNSILNTRWRLKSGYVVDKEAAIDDVFTNITIHEYVEWNKENNIAGWPQNLIKPRIIDENPYTKFYYYDGLNKVPKTYTLGEINDMIENGTLEEHFTRIK